jgi:hypothetical protein
MDARLSRPERRRHTGAAVGQTRILIVTAIPAEQELRLLSAVLTVAVVWDAGSDWCAGRSLTAALAFTRPPLIALRPIMLHRNHHPSFHDELLTSNRRRAAQPRV